MYTQKVLLYIMFYSTLPILTERAMAVTTPHIYSLAINHIFSYNGLVIYFTWSLSHILHINVNIFFYNQLNPSIFNEYMTSTNYFSSHAVASTSRVKVMPPVEIAWSIKCMTLWSIKCMTLRKSRYVCPVLCHMHISVTQFHPYY